MRCTRSRRLRGFKWRFFTGGPVTAVRYATGMKILATTHIPSPELFGPASISAAILVSAMAFAVRRSPPPQCEGLSILAPPVCLLLAVYSTVAVYLPDVQHYVATFIYLAASFVFAVHNFQFQHRFHWIHGAICSFLAGALVVLFGSMLAIRGAFTDVAATPLICAAETLFIVCWSAVLYALFTRCRIRTSNPSSSTIKSSVGVLMPRTMNEPNIRGSRRL